jgi:cyclophilin family peptidyl-prolyl cis-trans isomerase
MSPKKKQKHVRKEQPQIKKAQPQNSEKIIQYVAVAVVLIVIGLIAWQYIPKSQPEASAPSPSSTSNSAVCKQFDSIPTAKQYEAPPMKIDKAKQYFANFKMAKGEFIVQLYPDKAPITVNSFVFLTCKGFFNGLTFHRVLEGFMAQGGDPDGTGGGGPGYEFVNENSDLAFDKAGVVAMANAGPGTNGSQFFIMFDAYGLSGNDYTIFGQVIEGMDVVNGITRRDPNTNPTFEGDKMESVTISEK